jgi:hypothetical protein
MESSLFLSMCFKRISNELDENEKALFIDQLHDIRTRPFERTEKCHSIDHSNRNRKNSIDAIHD